MAIILPKKGQKAKWTKEFDVDGNLEKYLVAKPSVQPDSPQSPNMSPVIGGRVTNLTIRKNGNIWEVRGQYEGTNNSYKVDLSNQLLGSKTQDQHVQQTKQARASGDFGIFSMADYHTLFDALYCLKDTNEAREAKEFIKQTFRTKYPLTLTRIRYNPQGLDEVIQDYSLPNQKKDLDFIGKDGEIVSLNLQKELEVITGESNVQRIRDIYNWINETNVYLWRVNSKPQSIDERVARFNAYSDRAGLDCGGNPSLTYVGLGVRFVSP